MVTYYDEAGSIDQRVYDTLFNKALTKIKTGHVVAPSDRFKAIHVSCSVCQAREGERCRAVRQHFNWVNGWHTERLNYYSELVSQARRALLHVT